MIGASCLMPGSAVDAEAPQNVLFVQFSTVADSLHKITKMRCPECGVANESDRTACSGCGLLLFNVKSVKRRQEDVLHQKRRDSDASKIECPFCQGQVQLGALHCKHCGQIVSDEYRQDIAQRRRAQINYASWVAYIFGLVILLFFRPVGLLSIGAGLLLSIVYYAIPVETYSPKKKQAKRSLLQFLKRQFRFERTEMAVPRFGSKKLIFIGTPALAALIGFIANQLFLQRPMDQILHDNDAYKGMSVSAHYEYWVVPGVIVYDLKTVGSKQTPLDVHTAFLEYAKKMQGTKFRRVELSYRGAKKFDIEGPVFHRIGQEYQKKNFGYVLFDFPRLLRPSAAGRKASDDSRQALIEVHKAWYGTSGV